MLHIRLYLIHKGGMRGEHLRKGLFQVHLFLGRWFAHSEWWRVVQIVPPSITLITLIILIITPPLALILVLIVVTPILDHVTYFDEVGQVHIRILIWQSVEQDVLKHL